MSVLDHLLDNFDASVVLFLISGAILWLLCSLISFKHGWSISGIFLIRWLLIVSFAVRVMVYLGLPSTVSYETLSPDSRLYFDTL